MLFRSEKNSIAGSALLGLHHLAEHDHAFNAREIDRLALRLTRAKETDPASRLTAVQVCAERGLTEALPVIQALAQNSPAFPVRVSAIAAIGRLGGKAQMIWLHHLEGGGDETVRDAARWALAQLRQRQRTL